MPKGQQKAAQDNAPKLTTKEKKKKKQDKLVAKGKPKTGIA